MRKLSDEEKRARGTLRRERRPLPVRIVLEAAYGERFAAVALDRRGPHGQAVHEAMRRANLHLHASDDAPVPADDAWFDGYAEVFCLRPPADLATRRLAWLMLCSILWTTGSQCPPEAAVGACVEMAAAIVARRGTRNVVMNAGPSWLRSRWR